MNGRNVLPPVRLTVTVGPQRTAVGPREFSRQSRQLNGVKALTSMFLAYSRQPRAVKALVAVRALLRCVSRRSGLTWPNTQNPMWVDRRRYRRLPPPQLGFEGFDGHAHALTS